MRNTEGWKSIKVKESTHKFLIQELKEFERVIGGGSWSMDDTINEIIKIAKGGYDK